MECVKVANPSCFLGSSPVEICAAVDAENRQEVGGAGGGEMPSQVAAASAGEGAEVLGQAVF